MSTNTRKTRKKKINKNKNKNIKVNINKTTATNNEQPVSSGCFGVQKLKTVLKILFFPIVLIYFELLYHIATFTISQAIFTIFIVKSLW